MMPSATQILEKLGYENKERNNDGECKICNKQAVWAFFLRCCNNKPLKTIFSKSTLFYGSKVVGGSCGLVTLWHCIIIWHHFGFHILVLSLYRENNVTNSTACVLNVLENVVFSQSFKGLIRKWFYTLRYLSCKSFNAIAVSSRWALYYQSFLSALVCPCSAGTLLCVRQLFPSFLLEAQNHCIQQFTVGSLWR